ncbi:hypothetical protein [Duganella sp.]|uniref:hypothetical protein n=1 Tax=Duganella sp. TaxID=1904440 RepID=UPI0031D8D7C8
MRAFLKGIINRVQIIRALSHYPQLSLPAFSLKNISPALAAVTVAFILLLLIVANEDAVSGNR